MKIIVLPALVLAFVLINRPAAQAQSSAATPLAVKPATGSSEGLKRKGAGKMSSGVSRNGNSNLSPTGPTNTQGSTSQAGGGGSSASPGGAPGTNVMEVKQRPSQAGVRGKTPANGSTKDGGLTGKGKARAVSTADMQQQSTSGKTGSRRPTSQAGVDKEARTNDKNVGTPTPNTKGLGAPGTPQGPLGKTGQKVKNNR
jgi:hypothetical protein